MKELKITVSLDEEQLTDLFKGRIKEIVMSSLKDSGLIYWVRDRVHAALADKVLDNIVKERLNGNELEKMLKVAIENFVDDKFTIRSDE